MGCCPFFVSWDAHNCSSALYLWTGMPYSSLFWIMFVISFLFCYTDIFFALSALRLVNWEVYLRLKIHASLPKCILWSIQIALSYQRIKYWYFDDIWKPRSRTICKRWLRYIGKKVGLLKFWWEAQLQHFKTVQPISIPWAPRWCDLIAKSMSLFLTGMLASSVGLAGSKEIWHHTTTLVSPGPHFWGNWVV